MICPNLSVSRTIVLYDYEHLTTNVFPDSIIKCIGKPVNIAKSATSGAIQSYAWSNGSTASQISFIASATNTNMWYSVQVISSCGVDTLQDSVYVQAIDTNGAIISISHYIQYEACPLPDTLVVHLAAGVTSPILYPLSVTGTALNNIDFTFIDTLVQLVPGVLDYYFPFSIIFDGLNNESTEFVQIKIAPKPNMCVCSKATTKKIQIIDSSQVHVLLTDTMLSCPGQSIALNPTEQSANGTIFWNTFNVTDSIYNFTAINNDTTQIVVSISDTVCGLPTYDVDTAYIFPANYSQVQITAPVSMVLPCLNSILNFNAVISGGTNNCQYWWFNADNSVIDIDSVLSQNITQNTSYKLVVKDGCNRKDTMLFSVTEQPRPEFALSAIDNFTAQCPNQSLNIVSIVTGGLPPYSYSWSSGEITSNLQLIVNQNTQLILTAKDSCATERRKIITVNAAQYSPPILSIEADTVVCPAQKSIILAQANGGVSDYQYTFTSNASNTFVSNALGVIEATINASAFFKITCIDACQHIVEDSIYIRRYHDCDARTTNVIATDGSPGNRAMYISHVEEYPNTHVIIYNRWGVKVYETYNFTNENAWIADNVDAGTVYYIIEFNPQYMPENNKQTGYIQIIK